MELGLQDQEGTLSQFYDPPSMCKTSCNFTHEIQQYLLNAVVQIKIKVYSVNHMHKHVLTHPLGLDLV